MRLWLHSFNLFTVTCMTFVHEAFCSSLQRLTRYFRSHCRWQLYNTQHFWWDLLPVLYV